MDGIQDPDCDLVDASSWAKPTLSGHKRRRLNSFMRPDDMLRDHVLTQAEKREMLASWASDIRAVPDAPALRQLDNGAVVLIDEILAALKSLDGGEEHEQNTQGIPRYFARRSSMRSPVRLESARRRRSRSDDDDDPPPCPPMINRAPVGPLSGGEAVGSELALVA